MMTFIARNALIDCRYCFRTNLATEQHILLRHAHTRVIAIASACELGTVIVSGVPVRDQGFHLYKVEYIHYLSLDRLCAAVKTQISVMAEKKDATKGAVRDLEKEITCAICHEHYQEPKVLPCCHYYCKQCVYQLA